MKNILKARILHRWLLLSLLALLPLLPSTARDAKGRFVVVIDPGHGGKDSGALGAKSKEKDIVLAVALKVGEKIAASNPNIVLHYTRSTDEFIGLMERARFANKRKADLFVSIHANSNDRQAAQGCETYVLGLHRTADNLAVAMKENAAILYEEDHSVKYADFDPRSDESYIMFQFIQNKHLDASISLAELVQKGMVRCGLKNRGVKQAGFLVLREVAMPSILIELGFISNRADEAYMTSASGQEELSGKIAKAVLQYETTLAKKSGKKSSRQEAKPAPKAKSSTAEVSTLPDSTIYRVQVLADKRLLPYTHRSFRGYEGEVWHYKEGNYYKYTIYSTSDLSEAKQREKELRKRFKDCFVVSFDAQGNKIGSYH